MSVVTGIVLCASCGEPEFPELANGDAGDPIWLVAVNGWLAEKSKIWRLDLVEDDFGGGKHPQMRVAGGGFNYFPEDEFLEFIKNHPWETPDNVVLIMQPEDGPTRVWQGT